MACSYYPAATGDAGQATENAVREQTPINSSAQSDSREDIPSNTSQPQRYVPSETGEPQSRPVQSNDGTAGHVRSEVAQESTTHDYVDASKKQNADTKSSSTIKPNGETVQHMSTTNTFSNNNNNNNTSSTLEKLNTNVTFNNNTSPPNGVSHPSPTDSDASPTKAEKISSDGSSENETLPTDQKAAPRRPALSRQQSQAHSYSKARTIVIVFSLCMALFLAALDVTIITTAIPTIATVFQASSADYAWVGSSYLLANASSVPLWGKFSDIWGRKPMLLIANVIFMIGSLVAALATSIGMLIGGRVIQGIGGGGLIILVNITIADLFSMRERPKYYGIVGMVWAIASGVGPIIGGVFTESVTWRWCFYINLPLDGLSLVLLTFFLKLETPKTPLWAGVKAIDWIGVITIVGGVIMFLMGMEAGGVTRPWDSAYVLCLIIFGIVSLVLFFINEWRFAKYPIVPVRLFKDYSNIAALGVCFVHGFVFIASTYFLPLYFQTVISATPILSGVYLFALVVPLSLMSGAVGIFIKKTGKFRPAIWFGLVMMTLGYGLFIDLPTSPGWAKILIYQIIAGIGIGPNFQSPLIALQSHVKGHDIAVATATFGFVRNLSTAIAVVLGSVVFQNQLASYSGLLQRALPADVAAQLTASSYGSTTSFLRSLPSEQKDLINTVYTESLSTMWIFFTAVSAAGILISFAITERELSTTHEKAKTGIEEQERVRVVEAEERRARKEAGNSRDARRGGSKGVSRRNSAELKPQKQEV